MGSEGREAGPGVFGNWWSWHRRKGGLVRYGVFRRIRVVVIRSLHHEGTPGLRWNGVLVVVAAGGEAARSGQRARNRSKVTSRNFH